MWLIAVIAACIALLVIGAVMVDRRDRRAGRRPGGNPDMGRLIRDEKRDARAVNVPAMMIEDSSWTAFHRRNRS